jgi:taurine dioxygenase
MTLRVEPVTGRIGAEVSGVDLSQPLDEVTFKELEQAWYEHLVLFFHDQHLTPARQKALGERFGPLHVHPYVRNLGPELPEILVLESETSGGRPSWHSDVSFLEAPPMASILQAIAIPAVGGDTAFSNMYAAYSALSAPMQAFLDGLEAVHDGTSTFGRGGVRSPSVIHDERRAQLEQAVHPVVRVHPVTGRRALFVNEQFTSHVVGLSPAESRNLLDFLYGHLQRIDFTTRMRWRPGSVALWDNRCVQHTGIPDWTGDGVQRRRMHRVAILGDRPRGLDARR